MQIIIKMFNAVIEDTKSWKASIDAIAVLIDEGTLQLTKKGEEAHLHYSQNPETIRCLNCHLFVGHFSKQKQLTMQFGEKKEGPKEYFTEPANVKEFINFTEFIPSSSVKFDMMAIPGGTFQIGSAESEPFRKDDEGPVKTVKVSPFWIGKTEVTWDEYQSFYI